jgi:peptide/nickel transport system substrate-binding protein
MKFNLKLRSAVALVALTSAVTLTLSATPASVAGATSGTVTYAEAPGAAPDWIFPYTGYQDFSASNLGQFQQLMYRPLYFFGLGASASFVPSLSLAAAPVLSAGNKTVTIRLKGWRFANGQVVDASSVMFFLNLYHADPTNYGAYTPGVGIPDQIASASGSGLTVVLHMKSAVNANWLLYNYLSEITPLPATWDVSAAHVGARCATGTFGAASTDLSCKAVEAYLDKMAGATSTFTSAFWQGGDDGPWRLSSFDAAGNATFEANPRYSGPQKAQVRAVKEVAYTSESTEKSDLVANKLDLGYLDVSDLVTPAPKPGVVGANLGSLNAHYRLVADPSYSFDFAQINYSSSNPLEAEFAQTYFRQALQQSLDQTSILKTVDDNYGVAGFSPLPSSTPPALSKVPVDHYPFNATSAKALLTSHGWTEVAGVMTCTSPGTAASDCGANIAIGAPLTFTLMYVTGDPAVDATVNDMVADWTAIGVDVTATANTFNNLATACTVGSGTPWSMCWSGEPWTYEPNYYPSGEQNFLSGASSNWGGYANAQMNALIQAEMTGKATLSAFEQYAADQVPVLYLPDADGLVEVNRSLKSSIGFENVLGNFLPEYLHF